MCSCKHVCCCVGVAAGNDGGGPHKAAKCRGDHAHSSNLQLKGWAVGHYRQRATLTVMRLQLYWAWQLQAQHSSLHSSTAELSVTTGSASHSL